MVIVRAQGRRLSLGILIKTSLATALKATRYLPRNMSLLSDIKFHKQQKIYGVCKLSKGMR